MIPHGMERDPRRTNRTAALGLALALVAGCETAAPYEPRYRPPEPVVDPPVRVEPEPREITVEPLEIPVEPPTRAQVEQAAEAPARAEIEARIRYAGRQQLAGLPAVRAAARERGRDRALNEIAEELEGPHSHLWTSHLIEILRAEFEPSDELWCAAAFVVGEVGRYDLARHLAPALEGEQPTRRGLAAQEAFHSLYGRWFTTMAEVEPYLTAIQPGPGTDLLLRNNAAAETAGRERLFDSLRHDPQAAEIWFQDPDPLVRAGAARIVGEVLPSAEGRSEERERMLALVFARIEVELEPRAFHAAVQTVARSQESSPADAPELVALRTKLTELVRTSTDARTLSVAQAYSRMPWRLDGAVDDAHLLTGVARLGEMLQRVDVSEGLSGQSDPDLVLGVMQSLLVLCDRARGTGLESELRRSPARVPVFEILQDVHRDETVRAAAVNSLSSFALPEDWQLLVSVLARGDTTPALSHALLGALPSILVQFEPGSTQATALLDQVGRLSGAGDPDLRRRALALLADPRVADHVQGMDPGFLIVRLEHEEVPDLTRTVLRLLRELGTPEMFAEVLGTRRFDEIAAGRTGNISELAATLGALAAGRADESMLAATRLASVPAPDTELSRMRNALSIVASLDEAAANELGPEAHRRVCAWAWRLQTAGVSLEGSTPEGLFFVQRLVHLHWPAGIAGYVAAAPANDFDEAARHHLLAVASGVLVVDQVPGNTLAETEEAFARALEFAPDHSTPNFAYQVRRDRARFRAAVGESVKALTDYRALIEVDYLEIPDLRVAVALLSKLGGASEAGERAIAPEKFDLLGRIVGRERWFDELPLVRVGDLTDLADTAILSRDPERMQRFVDAMGGLPETVGPSPPAVEPPLWEGLTEEADSLEELRRAHDRVRAMLGKTGAVLGSPVPASKKG